MEEVYILAGARTPIGRFQGSLSGYTTTELGATAARAALERAGVEAEAVESVVAGNVVPTGTHDMYLSRGLGRRAGVPDSAFAMNVNRLCGSGVQAIVSATLEIASGASEISLAGGVESMSNAPYTVDGLRKGARMGNGTTQDWLLGTLNCPFGSGHMGVTAENIAKEYGITREEQDQFALVSQQRANNAVQSGLFDEEIVPVGDFTRDEHPREVTLESLAKMKPAFQKEGTVTAGNASGINDGASMLVLAGGAAVQRRGLKPLARVAGFGIAGVPPHVMGLGPIHAVPKALKMAGITLDDVGVIESNEAFAAQALAVSKVLEFDPEITNPNGGAIALGHPVGATGAILTVKALHHMQREQLRYGLITLCIGGGQGIALVLERAE